MAARKRPQKSQLELFGAPPAAPTGAPAAPEEAPPRTPAPGDSAPARAGVAEPALPPAAPADFAQAAVGPADSERAPAARPAESGRAPAAPADPERAPAAPADSAQAAARPAEPALPPAAPEESPAPSPEAPPPHGPPAGAAPAAFLRGEANLAMLAGAGAGKTWSLVTLCLHLLAGARRGHAPVPPAALGLLTFTDKAAGEMRSRLRARLDALADGRDDEVVLRAAFAELGRPFPERRAWRALREDLGAATIGTFHALCTQLLRRAPPSSGVNPHFELLEEREGRQLLDATVTRVVLGRVQGGDEAVRQLVTELGFGGLVQALGPVATRIREEGLLPAQVPVADGAALRRQFDETLASALAAGRAGRGTVGKHEDRLAQALEVLAAARFETWPEAPPRLKAPLARLAGVIGELRVAAQALTALHGAARMAPLEAAVRDVLSEIAEAHRAALTQRGALDFTGLLVETRNLLRDVPEARREAWSRFGALLVDEFQDTNRVQLEIVLLLAEAREGGPRAVTGALDAARWPLEPAFLTVVGDRKQAIYEFRGADVSVFELMAAAIEASGGARAFLTWSRRSAPALVAALNATFTRALGPGAYEGAPEDFEVVYRPEHDDLHAHRRVDAGTAPVVALHDASLPEKVDAETLRHADADAVARLVAQALADGTWPVVPRDEKGPPHPARGGDVALLFQRFTHLEVYRQALVRHGVRHRVVRGRGFYGAQEVVDLASLLALLADPADARALAAVLRSPLVGLSDTALVSLARPRPGVRWGLRPRAVLFGEVPQDALSAGEAAALGTFRAAYDALRRERDRLGLRALLRVALEALGFRVAVAAGPFGEQALANLDKLLELAAARERAGVGVAAFAAELLELADAQPTEAQGEVVDEADPDAVTLCTVHQAKGLEWPVVVVPDLQARPNVRGGPVRFDRTLGLAVRPPDEAGSGAESLTAQRLGELRARRARAENLRLFYVALTRARDRVVLGLAPPKPTKGTWALELREALEGVPAVARVDAAALPPGRPAGAPPPPSPEAVAEVRAVVDAVRRASAARPRALVLPVTQLEDFVTCPRRFHLAHQVGLAERPVALEWRDADDEEAPPGDARARGAAAHRLLEKTPLELVGTPALRPALEALRRAEGLEAAADEEVLEWVQAFWGTAFARGLGAAGVAVHRELPFALTLEDGEGPALVLRGQIDLLAAAPGGLTVVDYKASRAPAAGLGPYRFQLGCYALAARRFAGGEGPVRAGLVFLREADREPRLVEAALAPGALVAAARALALAQGAQRWAGRPRTTCEAVGCGYLARCHPGK